MRTLRGKCSIIVLGCLTLWSGMLASPLWGQQQSTSEKAEAPLVVDGVVRQVFRGAKPGRNDYLVQIEVARCEGRKTSPVESHAAFPAPGDSVYVHVSPRQDATGRALSGDKTAGAETGLPDESARIRAYLAPRTQGGWQGATPDWFEPLQTVSVTASEPGHSGPADSKSGRPMVSSLGMTTEALQVEGRLALRVTSVERNGAAQTAGLEAGDVIIGAEGAALKTADSLEELARKGEPFSLIVVDVNTGRGAQIEVTPQTRVAANDARPTTTPSAQATKVSLGLSAEPVKLGSRSALKVTRVEPNSAAAKAGIEVGDIVVAANGVPTTGPEQLVSALRKSGSSLKLTVRDVRKGNDVDVDVPLSGARPAKPLPTEGQVPSAAPKTKLGAVTELAFHDDEFAVKVTEVETGSPASRAGLLPGTLILAANGKPVLHPNDLNDIVRQSAGTLKLTVIDPLSGSKRNVEVSLGS